jgi:hypothetical protein
VRIESGAVDARQRSNILHAYSLKSFAADKFEKSLFKVLWVRITRGSIFSLDNIFTSLLLRQQKPFYDG